MNIRDPDTSEICKIEEAYDAAWNAGDVEALIALFSPDAVVVNPLGKIARGRAEIQCVLEQFLAGAARGSRHTSTVSSIDFITDEVAIVDGEAQLEGVSDAALRQSVLAHNFTDVMVKIDGNWFIAHVRAYVFSAPSR
jgi:uncharacterized protein (TIGR02246 family)